MKKFVSLVIKRGRTHLGIICLSLLTFSKLWQSIHNPLLWAGMHSQDKLPHMKVYWKYNAKSFFAINFLFLQYGFLIPFAFLGWWEGGGVVVRGLCWFACLLYLQLMGFVSLVYWIKVFYNYLTLYTICFYECSWIYITFNIQLWQSSIKINNKHIKWIRRVTGDLKL